MNHELDKLQLEEFIESSLLDMKSRLQDTLSIVIVQLDCCLNRKKRIEEEIELYEKTMEYEGLTFDNITPLKSKKEKHHGTRIA